MIIGYRESGVAATLLRGVTVKAEVEAAWFNPSPTRQVRNGRAAVEKGRHCVLHRWKFGCSVLKVSVRRMFWVKRPLTTKFAINADDKRGTYD